MTCAQGLLCLLWGEMECYGTGSDFLKNAAGSGAHLPDHSPAEVALLQRAQPTSASVERSFSILKKMLSPGRNSDKDNVHLYLIMRFNCSK